MPASHEERFIAEHFERLSAGLPGAFALKDDCAELVPAPGHAFIVKTDPIVEGLHFLPGDDPADVAYKALAVNVSDLVAKAARPYAYLMALGLPKAPAADWMARFTAGLDQAQRAFALTLAGGDTDAVTGPATIAVTVIGECPVGRMVRRGGARAGDIVYVTGSLGGAALGLALRLDAPAADGWPLTPAQRQRALARYLRPEPKLGVYAALRAYATAAMDISDGLVKDLDRMCRLGAGGPLAAEVAFEALPLFDGLRATLAAGHDKALQLISSGDDYEVLTTVAPVHAEAFEALAAKGGVTVTAIGRMAQADGGGDPVRLIDADGRRIELPKAGFDHFER